MIYDTSSGQTQERLSFLAPKFVAEANTPSLRGLEAKLEKEIIRLHFYYDGEISEEEREEMSILATELFAQFTCPFLEEKYTRVDFPEPIPQSPYLSYIQKERDR